MLIFLGLMGLKRREGKEKSWKICNRKRAKRQWNLWYM